MTRFGRVSVNANHAIKWDLHCKGAPLASNCERCKFSRVVIQRETKSFVCNSLHTPFNININISVNYTYVTVIPREMNLLKVLFAYFTHSHTST